MVVPSLGGFWLWGFRVHFSGLGFRCSRGFYMDMVLEALHRVQDLMEGVENI